MRLQMDTISSPLPNSMVSYFVIFWPFNRELDERAILRPGAHQAQCSECESGHPKPTHECKASEITLGRYRALPDAARDPVCKVAPFLPFKGRRTHVQIQVQLRTQGIWGLSTVQRSVKFQILERDCSFNLPSDGTDEHRCGSQRRRPCCTMRLIVILIHNFETYLNNLE